MGIRDVLVHVDGNSASIERFALAARLAWRHDARLRAIHVIDVAFPLVANGNGVAVAELAAQVRAQALATAGRLEAWVNDALARQGLRGSWHLAEGNLREQMLLYARCADLVVLGQPDYATHAPDGRDLLEACLFGAGRPILLVPRKPGFPRPTERAVVGWDASREATRAIHDALPLLQASAGVTLVRANPGGHGQGLDAGSDIAVHLVEHGVSVDVEQCHDATLTAGEILLRRAMEVGAGLLVVGGYGHSRLRETIFGGVTRHVLRHMTLPVLISH